MAIEKLAKLYNTFQHEFGQAQSYDSFNSIICKHFADSFTKVANGNQLVGSRDSLLSQLQEVKGFAGDWSINEIFLIPSHDGEYCTIRYKLESVKAGVFDIIAVLHSKDGEQIERIDEVFYQAS